MCHIEIVCRKKYIWKINKQKSDLMYQHIEQQLITMIYSASTNIAVEYLIDSICQIVFVADELIIIATTDEVV